VLTTDATTNEEVLGMKIVKVLAAAMLLAFASEAAAQEGDVEAGAAYAKQVCAACHAVLPNEQISPLLQAPTFQSVANTRGMTELALTVWLQSSHPTMPNIVLKPDDLRNVVAYIRSLKRKK
jgi:mono/diheme cytochrome c family protein